MAQTEHPELIATADAAERLGLDVSTISRWVAAGRITPAMRLRGKTGPMLFHPVDVDRLADELAEAASS